MSVAACCVPGGGERSTEAWLCENICAAAWIKRSQLRPTRALKPSPALSSAASEKNHRPPPPASPRFPIRVDVVVAASTIHASCLHHREKVLPCLHPLVVRAAERE
jgi:hypothetical protein